MSTTPISITNKITSFPVPSLPRELVHVISTFFEPAQISCFISINKTWKTAFNDNLIWSSRAVEIGANIVPPMNAVLGSYRSACVEGEFDPRILRIISGYYGKTENAKQQFSNPTPTIVFGQQEWIDHVGDPGLVPRLPLNIHTILQEPCKFWPGKTVEETHKLVLIPKTVTRFIKSRDSFVTVPLTLKTLGALISSSHDGRGVSFANLNPAMLREHGDTPVKKSHWVLLTNNVIDGSRDSDYADQEKLVTLKGYKVPSALAVSAVALVENLRSGKRLLSNPPKTYTLCQEENYINRVIVGGFKPSGLNVELNYVDPENSLGMMAMREFLND
ncbi:MAG: hypothetical protein V4487_02490 [Chlamydiota bacterium]